jgi:hypothetical protein
MSKDHFEVFLRGNRVEEATTLEEVLALENSRQQAIARLVLTSSASTQGAARPEHEVQVDFDSRSVSKSASGGTTKTSKILVSVRSDSSGWASRTLSDVEEQIDRTRVQDIGQRGALVVLVVLLLFVLLALAGPSVRLYSPTTERTMWLRSADIDRVERILSQGATLTEAEMREIMTMQLRNVLNDQKPDASAGAPASAPSMKEMAFLFVPPSLMVVLALYLLVACYPNALFLWGDSLEYYEALKRTRTLLWSVVIGATVVSVFTNVFKEGLTSWLSRQ